MNPSTTPQSLSDYIKDRDRREVKVIPFRPVWLRRKDTGKDLTGYVNGTFQPSGSGGAA